MQGQQTLPPQSLLFEMYSISFYQPLYSERALLLPNAVEAPGRQPDKTLEEVGFFKGFVRIDWDSILGIEKNLRFLNHHLRCLAWVKTKVATAETTTELTQLMASVA